MGLHIGAAWAAWEQVVAQTPVKDVVIWAKHIHGDPVLGSKLAGLRGGELLELVVDGVKGSWRKMDDGRDGRPTRGIRPVGRMQEFWRELYATRRGEIVEIELATDSKASGAALISPPLARTEEERQEAINWLLSLPGRGWSSEGRTVTRDELYARE